MTAAPETERPASPVGAEWRGVRDAAIGLPRSADVVIVGGGTAGSVIARRLVDAGVGEALLLEAGPDPGPYEGGAWPVELLDAARLPLTHDWGYHGPVLGDREGAFARARVIGGCSAHNGCTQSWGWRGDYDAWADAGCPGWSADDLAPLFVRASVQMRVRGYAPDEVQPFQSAFVQAAVAAGITRTDDLDDLDGGAGVCLNPVNIVDGVRWNAAFAYLDAARDRPALMIRGNAHVDRVLTTRGATTGVLALWRGRRQLVRTPAVVLCAGAYGSPEVLLRSGIGPAGDLRALGIDVVGHLPGVGGNLHDHPALHLEYEASPGLAAELSAFSAASWMPDEQAIIKLDSGTGGDGPYDLHVFPWVEEDPTLPSGWRCIVPAGLLCPHSRGRLRLRSVDPTIRATLDHRMCTDDRDVEALASGAAMIREIVAAEPLRSALGAPLAIPPGDLARRAQHAWARANHQHYWHPGGTCRMGPDDDEETVVGPNGAVHGVSGLWVADGSIFPRLPRATPALPTVVLAERLAQTLTGAATTTAHVAPPTSQMKGPHI